jgi:hypothetical protein
MLIFLTYELQRSLYTCTVLYAFWRSVDSVFKHLKLKLKLKQLKLFSVILSDWVFANELRAL